jgi:hypothetical protein
VQITYLQVKNLKGLTCTGISQVAGGNMCGGRSDKVTNNRSYTLTAIRNTGTDTILKKKQNPLKNVV